MPNWVKTIVKTKPQVLKDIMSKYSSNGKLSFDKVIPMPKDLDITSDGNGEVGLMYLFLESKDEIFKMRINKIFHSLNSFHGDIYRNERFKEIEKNLEKYKKSPEFVKNIEVGKKYVSNYEKYGYATWYKWCIDNWGTKWDLSSFQNNEDTMMFETAWGFAKNIILELSNKYPDAVFMCEYADEGDIDNSGSLSIQNGYTIEERLGLSGDEIDRIWDTYFDIEPCQEKSSSDEEVEQNLKL